MAHRPPSSSPAASSGRPTTPSTSSSSDLREQILELVARGESQTSIAEKLGKSDAWVSGQVTHFQQKLGKYDFDAVRMLGKQMRAAGTTPLECFEALPLINTLRDIGANQDNLKELVTSFHDVLAKNPDVTPDRFADIIREVLVLSKQINTPLVQLPEYLAGATNKKGDLEKAIGKLEDQERLALSGRDAALENVQASLLDLEQFVYVRKELRKHGELFSAEATDADIVSEVNKLATMLNNARAHGYNSTELVARTTSVESLETRYKELFEDVNELGTRSGELTGLIEENSIIIGAYEKLQSMQFGIGELVTLYNLLHELAREKNLPVQEVKARFFKNVAEQYLHALNFELALKKLELDLTTNTEKLNNLNRDYANKKQVVDALDALLARGIKDKDILSWHTILQKYNAGIDVQSLASDLEAYGALKSSLENLNDQQIELQEYIDALWLDIDALEHEKKKVELQVSTLATNANEALKRISETAIQNIQCMTQRSTEDIRLISSDAKGIADSLKEEYGKIIELGGFGEFEPLIRAARGDRTVNFYSLKGSVIKAMELMIPRISQLDSRTIQDLSRARQTLRSATLDLAAD